MGMVVKDKTRHLCNDESVMCLDCGGDGYNMGQNYTE
jgi:hypothetical protein